MRTRVHRLICRALCASAVVFARVPVGRADDSVAGTWQAGASAMEVVVQSWGKDCGPQPRSTRSAGGGSVQLEQSGQVVTIRGAERDLRDLRLAQRSAAHSPRLPGVARWVLATTRLTAPLGGVERPRRVVRFARLIHRRVRAIGPAFGPQTRGPVR